MKKLICLLISCLIVITGTQNLSAFASGDTISFTSGSGMHCFMLGDTKAFDGIDLGSTLGDITPNVLVGNGELRAFDKNGNVISNDALMTTGTKLELLVNNQTADSAGAVIYGDINGSGTIDASDLLSIKQYLLKIKDFSGVYLKAGDITKSGSMDSSDLLALKKYLLKTYTIEQKFYLKIGSSHPNFSELTKTLTLVYGKDSTALLTTNTDSVTYSILSGTSVTVDSSGLLAVKSTGKSVVSATAGDLSDTLTVSVYPSEVQTIPSSFPGTVTPEIELNQVGYMPTLNKTAVTTAVSGSFYVVNADYGCVVYTGSPSAKMYDSVNLVYRYRLDFSSVTDSGRYYIRTSLGKSYEFSICGSVYKNIGDAMIKGLYYQRCGTALDSKYAGLYTHDNCHNTIAQLVGNPSVTADVSGGWHDAGDYGKYVTAGCDAVADMLYGYDLYKNGFSDSLNIPESSNNMPDILDEAKYEIDWLLKMQAPSGGVYHKVTTLNFAPFEMPEEDTAQLYLCPISLTATADFAAITAAAARIYAPFDTAFSQKCQSASVNAYNFALANESMAPFKNPPGVTTGVYGDSNSYDDVFWAATELYRLTGDQKYNTKIKSQYYKSFSKTSSVGVYGSLAYIFSSGADSSIVSQLKAGFINQANSILSDISNDVYNVSASKYDYFWGSNGALAGDAFIMIIGGILQNTNKYDNAVQNELSYLFGKNFNSKCYVTGFGTNPVMNPHHRPSASDEILNPVPGLMAGGPDDRLEDNSMKQHYGGVKPTSPASAYLDETGSYSTNEIAIYWNSAAFLVTGYFNSKQ